MARLTPRDIQEKEFASGFRGYKEEEVDEFLDRITSSYEEMFKENIDIKEEVERLHEENKKYELIGERMQAALVAAQETADDVRKNATKEAENILREAEIKAHKMVQESRDQHRELQKSLAIVKQIEEEFRFKLKSTLQSYLKLLDEVAIGETKDVKKWILPEDMAALGERRRTMEEQEAPVKEEKAAPAPEKKPEDTAPVPKLAPIEPKPEAKVEAPPAKKEEIKAEEKPAEVKKEEVKAEEKPAEAKKEEIVEDSKAKAAALLDEIAAQAAEAKKAEDAAEAIKPPAAKAEEPPAKAEAKPDEAPKPKAAEDKVPFDKDAGAASAVSSEWSKLQEAVDEAVKATDKPTKEEKEAKAAESTMPGEMMDRPAQAEPAKTAEPEAKAKDETKPAKTGKSALEDIEVVEDESFWKDI